ncbi:MAG: D-alanine--D-alanine ligase [Chloroflexi bacterium]|nr:D-alanine--D-alanine ligase [Chloroflexota bacterium]
MAGLKIGLLYNLKVNAPPLPGSPPDRWAELDSESTVQALTQALEAKGHEVIPMEGDLSLLPKLQETPIDIAFNICEGHFGQSRESQIPAILDMLRIPYTGSGVLTLGLTLDKPMCKRVLMAQGLPTPAFQVFTSVDDPLDPNLHFPLFVKPSVEGSGIGITGHSIVSDETALREQVAWLLDVYQQPALVEEYISGKEITVGLIGNWVREEKTEIRWSADGHRKSKYLHGLRVLPPMEVDFSAVPPEEKGIYTHRVKDELWKLPKYICPASISEEKSEELQRLSVAAFQAMGCLDMARIDFRLDQDLNPYILEINPLPGLAPGYSDLVIEAEADGLSHPELINSILDAARQRYGI